MSRCPACCGEPDSELVAVKEMMFGLDREFGYAQCSGCRSLWLVDVPEDLGEYYPRNYYSTDVDPAVAIGRPGVRQFATLVSRSTLFGQGRITAAARGLLRMRQFHSFVRVLDSMAFAGLPRGKQSRVLDVGCGSGLMVYALALAGIETAVGVDPFAPEDRTFDTGARVLRRDLADVSDTFDLVMFHHSFEHVPDPEASLTEAVRLLAPGGRILVRMPTRSSEAYDTYGSQWVQLDAPRHLTIFSREGMDELARRCALTISAVKDDSNSFQFWGSEQIRKGIPLMDERSQLISPERSIFTREQIDAWERESAALNARGRGDQAAWVLVKA